MYTNSYLNNNQFGTQPFGTFNNFGAYVPPQVQRPMVAPQQNQAPFSEVRYGTLDEAKGHIVMPANSVMFINRNLGEIYIKSANNMGEPSLEIYTYAKKENSDTNNSFDSSFNPQEFVKKDDIKELLTGFIKNDDIKDFATRKDFDKVIAQLQQIEKKIKINDILKSDSQKGDE